MQKLILPTIRNGVIGLVVLGLMLFLPAWTLAYWQAWVFIVVFTASTSTLGVYLALKDPALLERRIHAGPAAEQTTAQKIIASLAFGGLIGVMVFSAFDHRFGWSTVPPVVSIIGDVLVALGLFVDLLALRENTFAGSTVQKFEGQRVISTGLYASVRHPVYTGALIMSIGIPLALGSWWGFAFLALTIPVVVWRILDEEKLLKKDLQGYTEYLQTVRYRLVPYVW
jgi:protein-S-isoprenylcysteine O-methyltransferase Ste14